MSITTLIIGESGSGKSTSLRNLNPKETFVISTTNKPLPFKAFKKNYKCIVKDKKLTGNYYLSRDWLKINKALRFIDESRPDVKTIILDDFQYLMADEFFSRATEKGYEKFTEIGMHAWDVIKACTSLQRDELNVYILSHSDTDQFGKVKCKTLGKMLEDKGSIEGLFTIVMHAFVQDGKYLFNTQNDGSTIAKAPMGMFEDKIIDNDLAMVNQKIDAYYNL